MDYGEKLKLELQKNINELTDFEIEEVAKFVVKKLERKKERKELDLSWMGCLARHNSNLTIDDLKKEVDQFWSKSSN